MIRNGDVVLGWARAGQAEMASGLVTKQEIDKGAFKTPSLRNLSDTFPYMHDGSLATLEQVIEFFDKGGHPNPWLSPEVKPLGLNPEEKRDLLSFLAALNGDKVLIAEPKRFPQQLSRC